MLAKRIIPCLDIKDGRVVKGVNFVNLVVSKKNGLFISLDGIDFDKLNLLIDSADAILGISETASAVFLGNSPRYSDKAKK